MSLPVESLPRDQARQTLALVQAALRLSIPVLSKYPDQVAAQLTGRMMDAESEGIRDLLWHRHPVNHPWLRAMTPSLDQAGGALLGTLAGHTESINKIAVTPDDRYIISASDDGTLKLWDLKTMMEVRTFQAQHPVYHASVSCGGQRLIASVRLHEVKVWDIASGSQLWSLACDAGGVAATPESTIAVVATGIDLLVIDLASFEVKATLSGHEQFIENVTISKNGSLAASGTDEGNVRVWDLKRGVQFRSFEPGNFIYDLAFTPDNQYLISVNYQEGQLWDLAKSREARRFNLEYPTKVSLSGDGKVAFFTGAEGVSSWDIQTGKMINLLVSDADVFHDVQLSSAEHYLLTASSDKTLRVWQLDRLGKTDNFPSHESWNTQVRFSADGRRAISWGDVSIRVWDAKNYTPLFEITHEDWVVKWTHVSPDGQVGFLLFDKGDINLYDLESGKLLASLYSVIRTDFEGVEITPDRTRVLAIQRGQRLTRYAKATWLFIWEIDHIEVSGDDESLPGLRPAVEFKMPRSDVTIAIGGVDKTLSWVPDWRIFDPKSGDILGDLRDYLKFPTRLLEVPGLEQEPEVEPEAEGFRIEINPAGQLVVQTRDSHQQPLVFTCEGRVKSFDLHQDHRTLIVGDAKGKVYFLQIEGYPPLPVTGLEPEDDFTS